MDYEWIEKTFFFEKKSDQKIKTENQCQNAACEQKTH